MMLASPARQPTRHMELPEHPLGLLHPTQSPPCALDTLYWVFYLLAHYLPIDGAIYLYSSKRLSQFYLVSNACLVPGGGGGWAASRARVAAGGVRLVRCGDERQVWGSLEEAP